MMVDVSRQTVYSSPSSHNELTLSHVMVCSHGVSYTPVIHVNLGLYQLYQFGNSYIFTEIDVKVFNIQWVSISIELSAKKSWSWVI